MTGPISLGHSVKLIRVSELAEHIFKCSERTVRRLLRRLGVPIVRDYGSFGAVVSQAALEAAIFHDTLFRAEDGSQLPRAAARIYQQLAACDFCVLDRAALQRRLRHFAASLTDEPRRTGSRAGRSATLASPLDKLKGAS